MQLVDSHCHISSLWYEPVESLLSQMERNGVDRAVLIQMFGQFDNRELLDAKRRFSGRFAPVVMIDVSDLDAIATLRRLGREGAGGVRLEATSQSGGNDPLAIWKAAAELGLPVSCNGKTADYLTSAFQRIPESLPELKIVIEHLGRGDGNPASIVDEEAEFDALLELARYPNLYLRFHGLGELQPRRPRFDGGVTPFVVPERNRLVDAVNTFGPARMMWGSDFPPVSSREGYRNALQLPREALAHLSEDAIARLFGGTAAHVFRFD